jgi:hypothetical protein
VWRDVPELPQMTQELEHQDHQQQDYDKQDRYEASHGVPSLRLVHRQHPSTLTPDCDSFRSASIV